ncbi:GntR family transcriptional regulator [Jiangella mangrovi]|uniref:DNA-binding GntR family transcriptional regulator n=1 Tax=Jiangella mangrovi TaxID=1524084 RepID=A0A7W9GWI1_9ACTN|nr:GntR family transcriptional regulator [Jiangella mangrovi]MBB5791048.1 DNA-binding GntR family transcriptional regulator [Jiangella mangrovi]
MSTSDPQFRLGTATLAEALFESLRSRIISGQIEPGEKVTEFRLVEEYGVARPTAKSCIERLTGLGLLRRVAHKTAVVPKLGAEDIEDLFFSRSTFESTAVTLLARRREVPTDLVRAQRQIRLAEEHEDFAELVQADIAFHWGIVLGLGSERLTRMYEMISGEIHMTMGLHRAHRRTTLSTVVAEHQVVVDAVAAGDEAAARQGLETHIRLAKERVLADLQEAGTAAEEATV